MSDNQVNNAISSITGGCACGAIKYTVKGEPKFSLICHCRQCQRASGSGHAAVSAVRVDETEISGELNFYQQKADSGSTVSSGFCVTCGSPVLKKTTQMPALLLFYIGSMDNPSEFKPQVVVHEQSALQWDHVDPAIPRK